MLEGDRNYSPQAQQPEAKEYIDVRITLRGRFEDQADAVAFITAAHDATDETHSQVESVNEARERVTVTADGRVYR